jgi:hypothetical protein
LAVLKVLLMTWLATMLLMPSEQMSRVSPGAMGASTEMWGSIVTGNEEPPSA